MRLLIVQFSGDYRQAVQRFAAGQDEIYYAQRYSIDSVAKLTQRGAEVTVLCGNTETPYDQLLDNGVRAIGAGRSTRPRQLLPIMAAQHPTHLILRSPSPPLFRWAIHQQIRTLALFAESVISKGIRNRLRNYLLVNALNHPQIDWVGSYGLNSSLQLHQLGVAADKIVPWDFILETTPGDGSVKPLRQDGQPWTLFYIGSLRDDKGVGDILDAVAELQTRQIPVRLQLVGLDRDGYYAARAKDLGIAAAVEFLGIMPTKAVEPAMRAADVVLIPSWPTYPEGFPLTIHHALRSRTPIVASDHPMFRNKLQHRVSALIVPARQPTALANAIATLLADADLYQQLSQASYETWSQLRLPVKWADLIERWLDNSPADREWLSQQGLASRVNNSSG